MLSLMLCLRHNRDTLGTGLLPPFLQVRRLSPQEVR